MSKIQFTNSRLIKTGYDNQGLVIEHNALIRLMDANHAAMLSSAINRLVQQALSTAA